MAIHINIGSNTGDSATLIAEAVRRIGALLPERTMRVSEPYRSRAWGYESEHEYMNVGVMFEGRGVPTPSDARAFLGRLPGIEKALGHCPHRNADGTYRDRDLDIDIIDIDGMVLDTPDLTLPHPRMHLRKFVLEPIAEIDPGWIHPVRRMTAAELIEQI